VGIIIWQFLSAVGSNGQKWLDKRVILTIFGYSH